MTPDQHKRWINQLVTRAKTVARKLDERIRELLGDGKGPPSSAAPIEPPTLRFA